MAEGDIGRPSIYSAELIEEICRRLAEGRTLRDVCRDDDMPARSTIQLWLQKKEEFSVQYAIARERGYQEMADETLEIADDGTNDWVERGTSVVADHEHINRSRLRVDTRKWLLSKALPKIYGDRITQELTGKDGGPIETSTDSRDLARAVLSVLREAEIEK